MDGEGVEAVMSCRRACLCRSCSLSSMSLCTLRSSLRAAIASRRLQESDNKYIIKWWDAWRWKRMEGDRIEEKGGREQNISPSYLFL